MVRSTFENVLVTENKLPVSGDHDVPSHTLDATFVRAKIRRVDRYVCLGAGRANAKRVGVRAADTRRRVVLILIFSAAAEAANTEWNKTGGD